MSATFILALVAFISSWVQLFMNWAFQVRMLKKGVRVFTSPRAMRGALTKTGRRFKKAVRRLARKSSPAYAHSEIELLRYTPIEQV